jgi:hypothetical protein
MNFYQTPFSEDALAELLAAIAPHTLDYLIGMLVAAASTQRSFPAGVIFEVITESSEVVARNRAAMAIAELFERVEADFNHDPVLVSPDPDVAEECAEWARGYLHVALGAGLLDSVYGRALSGDFLHLARLAACAPDTELIAEYLHLIAERVATGISS